LGAGVRLLHSFSNIDGLRSVDKLIFVSSKENSKLPTFSVTLSGEESRKAVWEKTRFVTDLALDECNAVRQEGLDARL
jgi:CRISPR/Cas system CMR-associated protein Cmr1 (group 7 of RAMP superfamily)